MKKYLSLEDVKNEELAMCKKIDAFCEKNNIKYYLGSGSLLGAVRHGGFIPWDDDMDLIMLRDDYEKFIKSFKDDVLVVFSSENNNSILPFAKVCNTNIKVELNELNEQQPYLWVDIFPVDGLPENRVIRKLHIKYIGLLMYKIYARKSVSTNLWKKTIKRLMFPYLFSKPLGYSSIVANRITKLCMKYKVNESRFVSGVIWAHVYPKKIYMQRVKMRFEDYEFWTFKNWDAYLKITYGDYMKLPPVEKRVTHGLKAYVNE